MKYIIKANERDSKGNKYCYTCQSWKPETEFNKDNSKIDKLASQCRECRKIKDKVYRDRPENKAKAKIYFKQYYQANIKKLKEYEKQRSKTEHRQKYCKQYNEYWNSKLENQELKKRFDAEYYSDNKETICEKLRVKYNTSLNFRLNRIMSSNLYSSLKQNIS